MGNLEKPISLLLDKARKNKSRRIAVAAAEDKAVMESIKLAMEAGVAEPLLIGDKIKIHNILDELHINSQTLQIIDEKEPTNSAVIAVQMIREGRADILMKGFVATAPLLKAVLDKEKGLKKSNTLSHFALFDLPAYHKLIGLTDAAMNITPDFAEKTEILQNAIDVLHKLGCDMPKVAIISPVEVVNPKIESTIHASMFNLMNQRGQLNGCIVDGPLALDNAISKEAAHHKGIKGEVAGDADLLVVPNLDTGNVLYKSLVFLAGGITAAIITGAKAPIVLTSRADSEESKLMSIALAAAME